MAQTMTPAQQAKADAKADAGAAPDPYRDEMHAILGGMMGLLRHLVAVTPGAVQAHEQAVADLWDRLTVLRLGGKPPAK